VIVAVLLDKQRHCDFTWSHFRTTGKQDDKAALSCMAIIEPGVGKLSSPLRLPRR